MACGLAGLCYAEMASAVPVAGSAYTYSYATMGEFVAWIIGWDLVLEYAMGAATVGVGWSGYFVSMLDYFGIHLPAAITSAPLRFCSARRRGQRGRPPASIPGWNPTGSLFNLPAMLIVLLATYVLVVGIEESAKVNNLIVILKIAVVLLFVLFGVRYVNPENWHPFIPPNTGTFGEFGWSGVFRGAGSDLLRLHRLRRGEHGRAGGAEPAEGHADRHPGVARSSAPSSTSSCRSRSPAWSGTTGSTWPIRWRTQWSRSSGSAGSGR